MRCPRQRGTFFGPRGASKIAQRLLKKLASPAADHGPSIMGGQPRLEDHGSRTTAPQREHLGEHLGEYLGEYLEKI